MEVNTDTLAATIEHPAFVANGRRYQGRVLPIDRWREIARDAAKHAPGDAAGVAALAGRAVAAWFPTSRWRRWLRLGNPALRAFCSLPAPVQIAAIEAFCRCQQGASQLPEPVR